jgi:predicted NUDIX family NTP pyrophosphohydrolase
VAGRSAGLLLYKRVDAGLRVLLVHPGGPYWARKDAGVWSIPKGEYTDDEEPRAAALREFAEETGQPAPDGELLDLGSVRQRAGKEVTAWAVEGDLDVTALVSNTFELEWPPRSGRTRAFPEVDRAGWFDEPTAREKINAAQTTFLDRLAAALRT